MFRSLLSGIVIAAAALSPCEAQTDICMVGRTNQIDVEATNTWRRFAAQSDPQFLLALSGVWQTQIASPQTGQMAFLTYKYSPNGLFEYQSRTCGQTGLCSDMQGHGQVAGRMLGNGQFAGMMIVSDLDRNRQCIGFSGTFVAPDAIRDAAGNLTRKVQ